MSFFKTSALSVLFALSLPAYSVENIPMPPSPDQTTHVPSQKIETPPPPLPKLEDDSRNIPQPEVRIIRKKDTVIEEYRVNGQLRFIKITPSSGVAYYMADTDGDGILETRENDLDNPPINRWILLEW